MDPPPLPAGMSPAPTVATMTHSAPTTAPARTKVTAITTGATTSTATTPPRSATPVTFTSATTAAPKSIPIPTSTTAAAPNTVSSSLFRPSIHIKKEKQGKSKDKHKDMGKDKHRDIEKEKDPNADFYGDPYGKVALKRSRSPIKLLKNIKSYLHVHKHKYSNNPGVSSQFSSSSPFQHLLSGNSNYISHNNNLTPLQGSIDGNQSRSKPLSSSIISAAQLAQDDMQPRLPRERQFSGALNPEQQVLLLQVLSYFEDAGHPADEETAEYLLSFYQWDFHQTMQYCQDLVQAVQGTLVPVQQDTPLRGAVNDQMTSCYIDSLLFAMFARLSAFEGLLSVNLDPESDSDSDGSGEIVGDPRREEEKQVALRTHLLQTWLRMFVNQLRSGRLIEAHVIKELRQQLYSCGWHCPGPFDPPGSSRQEDSSELFMFLTEKLHLPYLPLEQRLLHGAKFSADDDKVITERMLQISIPSPEPQTTPSSPTRKLESTFSKLMSPKSSPDPSNLNSENGGSVYDVLSLEKLLAQYFYDNTLTGIRRVVSSGTGVPLSPGVEVPVSAWQVLELLPFYSSSNEQGGIIRASQSQYPADVVILPLILKRYTFGQDMQARRVNTPIDIPRRIDFSGFVNRQTSNNSFLPFPKDVKDPNISNDSSNNTGDGRGANNNESSHAPNTVEVGPNIPSTSSSSNVPLEPGGNVATFDASSSIHNLSSITINTQAPPIRKYSMSFLQAADYPQTPITPPPQYSPTTAYKPLLQHLNDDKKEWSPHPPPEETYIGDYLECGSPKVKYMLELKSVVCHIGSRLDSGHYRSYVADRVGKAPSPHTSTSTSPSAAHPPAFQEPNWLRFDDLDPSGQRVTLIPRDSIEDMDMETDWARNGYILFYELQTIQS